MNNSNDSRKSSLRHRKSKNFVEYDIQIPILVTAEDILQYEKELGLCENGTDLLALQLELNQNVDGLFGTVEESPHDNMPGPCTLDKVLKDFICPLRSENNIVFYDCQIDDILFLETFGTNEECNSVVSTQVGSSKSGPSVNAICEFHSRVSSIHDIADRDTLHEFTMIVDAFERVTQGLTPGSLLTAKQGERLLRNIVKFDYNTARYGAIFEHWRRLRTRHGRPLIREFSSPGTFAEDPVFGAFKPRQKERQLNAVRRQRKPNRDHHHKLYRMSVDFADLITMVSFMMKRDLCTDTERILKKLQFDERRKSIDDPLYSSPYDQRSLVSSANLILTSSLPNKGLANTTHIFQRFVLTDDTYIHKKPVPNTAKKVQDDVLEDFLFGM